MRFAAGTMEEVADHTNEVMLAIARMMPPELRGYYSETAASEIPASQPSSVVGDSVKDIASA
jgi:hypothetical protein